LLRSVCSASPSCRSSLLPVISVWTGLVGPASGGWKSFCCICLGSVLREAELVDSSVTSSFRTRSRSPSAGRPVIPFQLEVGFANLAVGILGIVAMGLRDGFRQATVIAGTVFGGGATVVHVMDVIESGNLAPGNTIQNVSNLLRPALLIAFLAASRRAERSPDSEAHTSGFDGWRGLRVRAAGLMTRERHRRVRRRLSHRSARHRYAGWDPPWRRSGRRRRSSFIRGKQRSPH